MALFIKDVILSHNNKYLFEKMTSMGNKPQRQKKKFVWKIDTHPVVMKMVVGGK